MKFTKKLAPILLGVFMTCNNNSVGIAQEKIEFHLAKIENHLLKNRDSTYSFMKSIVFLEENTGIESESDGTYFGKLNPTFENLAKWKAWYKSNREK